jgi:phasin
VSEPAQAPSRRENPKPFGEPSTSPLDFPKFEFLKLEIPPQFRDFAEKSAAKAKETCERMKSATDEMTERLEESYAAAGRGANEYGLQVIEAGRAHANSAFDYVAKVVAAKSVSEVIELTAAHAREQFDVLTEQSKRLTLLAQKVANETAEPIKEGMTKASKRAA